MKTFEQVKKKEVNEGFVDTAVVAMQSSSAIVTPIALNPASIARLTNRLGDEYHAYYMYRAASDWCKDQGYFKASAFFSKEMADELEHAKLIRDYMTGWNVVPQIPETQHNYTFTSLIDVINQAYNFELQLFNSYVADSTELFVLDLATFDFMKQLRDIQVSSVADFSDYLNALNLININNRFEVLYFENEYFD